MTICCIGKPLGNDRECYECWRKGDAECGYSYPLLESIRKSHNERSDIHITDLTGCLRRSFYSKTIPLEVEPQRQIVMFLGTAVHEAISMDHVEFKKEVPLYYSFGAKSGAVIHVVGSADLLCDRTLLDVKTTRWIYPKKLPYGSHSRQLNYYAAILNSGGDPEVVTKMQIQYIDMSGPTKTRCHKKTVVYANGVYRCPECNAAINDAHLGAVTVDVDIADRQQVLSEIEQRASTLFDSIQLGMAPDREESWLCELCDYKEHCYAS